MRVKEELALAKVGGEILDKKDVLDGVGLQTGKSVEERVESGRGPEESGRAQGRSEEERTGDG